MSWSTWAGGSDAVEAASWRSTRTRPVCSKTPLLQLQSLLIIPTAAVSWTDMDSPLLSICLKHQCNEVAQKADSARARGHAGAIDGGCGTRTAGLLCATDCEIMVQHAFN